MSGGVRVRCGVPVRGLVTAPDVPALQAYAQVQPRFAEREALLAPGYVVGQNGEPDVIAMRAGHGDGESHRPGPR